MAAVSAGHQFRALLTVKKKAQPHTGRLQQLTQDDLLFVRKEGLHSAFYGLETMNTAFSGPENEAAW